MFFSTVIAVSADDAAAKVAKRLPEGFALTGRVGVRSERHALWNVEVANLGGDVNHAWVILTSYGITPGDELGSVWQSVPGVGCFS